MDTQTSKYAIGLVQPAAKQLISEVLDFLKRGQHLGHDTWEELAEYGDLELLEDIAVQHLRKQEVTTLLKMKKT